MPEPDARLQNAIQRYGLANNEEWRTLLTHFDYQSGFAFVVVLVPGPDGVAPCRAELEWHLAESGKRVLDISPATGEELKQIAGRLLDLKVETEVGAVWMAAATAEANPDFEEWAAAWREGVARLNQFRNLLQRQIPCTLVFVGATWVQPIVRTMAPDLWSVRSKVISIRPLPLHFEPPSNWSPAPNRPADPNAPDPEFALQQADALRGKPGQELTLARILYRAGQGWLERREFEKAIDAFEESASMQGRFGAGLHDRARTEFALATSLEGRSNLEEALRRYEEAAGLFRSSGDQLGLANTLRSVGDLESRLGELDAVGQHYEEAARLFRAERNQLGLANTLQGLGDLESRLGELDAARQNYDEAMRLYRDERNQLGLANTLQSMGDLERRLGGLDAARQNYDEAMRLFRDERNQLGLANTLLSVGDLESRLGELDAAREHYAEAMRLYRDERNQLGVANTLRSIGDLESRLGRSEAARQQYDEAARLFSDERNQLGLANTLKSMGDLERRLGGLDAARQHYHEAARLYRDERDRLGLANTLKGMGDLERRLGGLDAARQHYDEAAHLFRDEQNQLGLANVWASLGDMESGLERWSEAQTAYETALPLYRSERVSLGLAHTLAGLARLALAQGRANDVPPLLAEAHELAQRSGIPDVMKYVEQVSQETAPKPE